VLNALIVFAAAEAHGEESSKTLFYIAGGLLALWAVTVSALGISRHENWPAEGASRAITGVSVVLVAFTMAAAVITG
jgi:hypothetical protein